MIDMMMRCSSLTPSLSPLISSHSLPLLATSLLSCCLSPSSPVGLGFELLQDGYSNISNIDISASVISQMNRMQRENSEWGRENIGDRRGRDREREGGDDNANELDCK
jgi:hypothetical protein